MCVCTSVWPSACACVFILLYACLFVRVSAWSDCETTEKVSPTAMASDELTFTWTDIGYNKD